MNVKKGVSRQRGRLFVQGKILYRILPCRICIWHETAICDIIGRKRNRTGQQERTGKERNGI
ncbi:hypothetical protein BEI60_07275 [Eisenbergiella tayi]|nr:hypothetical protein BEI60_07275 [Eisenbergiella tayi]